MSKKHTLNYTTLKNKPVTKSKKVCIWSFFVFVVIMLFGSKSYTVGKPVYFPAFVG